jgi:hypothetical protein
MKREEKLSKIEKLFSTLFCFTADEALVYVKSAQYFPEKGLNKLIKTLEDGKKQQDGFLARRVKEDKNYIKNLAGFLKKTTNTLKGGYEKAEHREAESFLKNL